MLQFGMDGVEDMNSVIVDFPPRKSILEYEKMHAELVTSTYIPKYLKLLHHLVEHPLLIGVIDSREIFYLFHEIVGVSAAIEVEV